MFLEADDFMILMNLPAHMIDLGPTYPVTNEELTKLRDIGVKTILNYVDWDQIPIRGWDYVDNLVNQARHIGVKCILAAYKFPSTDLPDRFYSAYPGQSICKGILSFWNSEAQERAHEFYLETMKRYNGPDINIVMSEFLTGESALANTPCFYDDAALASHRAEVGGTPDITRPETIEWLRQWVVKHFIDTQEVLINQHNEIWDALQWLIGTQSTANGNFAREDILKAYRQKWPEASIVLLQYTYFAHGEPYPTIIQNNKKDFNLRVIVEANYCHGLPETTPIAIQKGFAGQIVCPLHPWRNIKRMEPWMFENIATAIKLWKSKA